MQIQANIYFTHSEVTCVPTDAALASYKEQLALDDGALEFRLRLFAARVRGDASCVHVALAVPPDCMLHPDGSATPFGGIPETELHLIAPRDDGRTAPVAIERRVCAEVAQFVHAYGMIPVALIVPGDGGERHVPMPKAEDPAIAGAVAPAAPLPAATNSSIAMPPALQRELHKRMRQDARKAERAGKSWPLGGVFKTGKGVAEQDRDRSTARVAARTRVADRSVSAAANTALAPPRYRRPALMTGAAACVAVLLGSAAFAPNGGSLRAPAPQVAPPIMPTATADAAAQAALSAAPRTPLPQVAERASPVPQASQGQDALPILLTSSTSLPHHANRDPIAATAPLAAAQTPRQMALPLVAAPNRSAAPHMTAATDPVPARMPVIFPTAPEIDEMTAVPPPDRPAQTGRAMAGLQATNLPTPAQALRPVTLLRPTAALARIAPQPRPERPAPALATAALAAPAMVAPAARTQIAFGPTSAPRPVARPVALMAGTGGRNASPAALDPVAIATDPLPQGPVAGLRVLAIVGTGDQRQALVQTGPNQTAVLVAGAATRRWRVLEVRRDGIVLSLDGRTQLLPIGL